MPRPDRPDVSLDELVIELRLVSDKDMAEIKLQSTKTGLPLGRLLVLSRLLSEEDLERLLKLQAIQRGCKLPLQLVLDAHRYAVHENLSVEEALAKAGVFAQIVSYSRLGTLLVDSKLITKPQLDEAQKLAYETRFPLGKMLTMHGAITQAQLELALDLQKQLREQSINKDEALAQLSNSMSGSTPNNLAASQSASTSAMIFAPQVLAPQNQGISPNLPNPPNKIDLGELLLVSGLITEQEFDAAFDQSIENNQNLEEVLVASGVCSSALIDIALELQKHVNSGDVSPAAAAESLIFIDDHR